MTTEQLHCEFRTIIQQANEDQRACIGSPYYAFGYFEKFASKMRKEAASELSALQKENAELRQLNSGLVEECANYRGLLYGCDEHKLWQGMACIGCMEKERDSLRTQNRELREACVQFIAWYHVDPLKGDKHWKELPDIIRQAEQALALQPEK